MRFAVATLAALGSSTALEVVSPLNHSDNPDQYEHGSTQRVIKNLPFHTRPILPTTRLVNESFQKSVQKSDHDSKNAEPPEFCSLKDLGILGGSGACSSEDDECVPWIVDTEPPSEDPYWGVCVSSAWNHNSPAEDALLQAATDVLNAPERQLAPMTCEEQCRFTGRPLIQLSNFNFDYFYELVEACDPVSNPNINKEYCPVELWKTSLNCWDVSEITDMSKAFYGSYYNFPLNCWDVSGVTNMTSMFYRASSFNQPLKEWDVSNVTSMKNMFYNAINFNQDINGWNTERVNDMSKMFQLALRFNQPIGSWNVSRVTNMASMFWDSRYFNQPIGSWDVSSVTSMSGTFFHARVFDQSISEWDVSSVEDMSLMLTKATIFNKPLGSWDVSRVTNMYQMFYEAKWFNQPIAEWKTSSVSNMGWMFRATRNNGFNQPIGAWDVSGVTKMDRMFDLNYSFNQPIEWWDVSNVGDMSGMFRRTFYFNQPIANWDTSKVTYMNSMFDGSYFNQPLEEWDTSNVLLMSLMFHEAYSFNQPLDNWDTSNVFQMKSMFREAYKFNQCLSTWAYKTPDTVIVTDMFEDSGCTNTTEPHQMIGPWCQTAEELCFDPSFPIPPTAAPDPTVSPTVSPTVATTVAPSAAPVPVTTEPTTKPTGDAHPCDNATGYETKKKFISCLELQGYPGSKRKKQCRKKAAKKACPGVCDLRCTCSDKSKYKIKKKKYKCSRVGKQGQPTCTTKIKGKTLVRDQCPATCQYCLL